MINPIINPIELEIEIADNGAIIRQLQQDGSILVEVVEGGEYKIEKKFGEILYFGFVNETMSTNKCKITINIEAL